MVNGIVWEEETLARISEARVKQKQAQDAAKEAEKDANHWRVYADALEKALELSKQQAVVHLNGQKFDIEHLLTQSTWDNLVAIMSANKGLLRVVDAVTFLVNAKVFNDREHARNVIYSTLYSHKRDIRRVRKGVYRLKDASEKEKRSVTKQRGTPRLKKAILELKTVNPDMTKEDVCQTLIKRGFNFRGKSPGRAVHLVWVNMGYAKKEDKPATPQTLLAVPST